MYHHSITISVFGDYDSLKNEIESVSPTEHLDWGVVCSADFDPDQAAQSSIVIFNGPADFAAARSCCPDACLVACLSADEENDLSSEAKECLDDIWRTPLTALGVRLHMNNLLAILEGRIYSLFLGHCLDTLINSMDDLVWFKDVNGIHLKVNDFFCGFVGKPREDVEGCSHNQIWGVSDTDHDCACQETEKAAIESGETVVAEEVVQIGNEKHLFKTIKSPLYGFVGEIIGTVGVGRDMTNLLNMGIELNMFIEMIPFPLMLCDFEENVTKVNSRFLEFFETNLECMSGVRWRDWYEQNILHEISPTGEDIYQRFMHDDGHVSFLKMLSHEMNDSFGNYLGVVNVFEDVTAEKELEYNIWKIANTDALTGLANRHAFYEYVKKIDNNEKIHLFYVDLDNFKQVNDNFGHKAGDEALKATATILRQVFGKDFSARLGGDEFIVCVRRNATLQDLENLAQSLIDLMKEKFASSEMLNRLSCSVGVSVDGSMREGIEALIKSTDKAMYEAKNLGKGRYCVYKANEDDHA